MAGADPGRDTRSAVGRSLRARLAGLIARVGVVVMGVAVRTVPSIRAAVVHGFPDTEENSLRIVAELRRRLPARWRVVLLCDDIAVTERAYRIAEPGAPPVTLLRRLGLRGYLVATVARLWVHTHGLYGSPRTGRGRCHVLVGHGHGPKRAIPYGVVHRRQHADLAFTNVRTWGTAVIDDLGVPRPAPRIVTASARSDLPPARSDDPLQMARTVLWLPTVRRTRTMLRGHWQDGTPVADQPDLVAELGRLRRAAESRGLRLATKAHALDADADRFDRLGIRVITTEQLLAAGSTFHQFVRSSAGLVTDYSSVFVDHLHSDLPIAFWTPDLADFRRDRGFNDPDVRDVAAELVLSEHATVERFLDVAAAGGVWQPEARAALAASIGLAPVPPTGGATATMVRRMLAQLGTAGPGPD